MLFLRVRSQKVVSEQSEVRRQSSQGMHQAPTCTPVHMIPRAHTLRATASVSLCLSRLGDAAGVHILLNRPPASLLSPSTRSSDLLLGWGKEGHTGCHTRTHVSSARVRESWCARARVHETGQKATTGFRGPKERQSGRMGRWSRSVCICVDRCTVWVLKCANNRVDEQQQQQRRLQSVYLLSIIEAGHGHPPFSINVTWP
jgi:hypothetical protein